MTAEGRESGASIEMTERDFIKRQEPALSSLEHARTELGRQVAEQTALFQVPRILAADDDAGSIRFERLEGLARYKEYISHAPDPRSLTRKVGSSLAAIHSQMEPLPGATTLDATSLGVRLRSAPVPIHGDFGPGNLLVKPGTLELTIVDWSGASWIGPDVVMGPAALDLGNFLICLYEMRPFGPSTVGKPSVLARDFLEAYAEDCTEGLDLADLRAVAGVLHARYMRKMTSRRGWLGTLAYTPYALALRHFLNRFCTLGSMSENGSPVAGSGSPGPI